MLTGNIGIGTERAIRITGYNSGLGRCAYSISDLGRSLNITEALCCLTVTKQPKSSA
ncbi:hypothetical protein D3C81_2032530 [compost metagenome]